MLSSSLIPHPPLRPAKRSCPSSRHSFSRELTPARLTPHARRLVFRATTSLSLRLKSLRSHVGLLALSRLSLCPVPTTPHVGGSANYTRQSFDQELWEAVPLLHSLRNDTFHRGDFTVLDCHRIDLPGSVSHSSNVWVTRLPPDIRPLFLDPRHQHFLTPLSAALKTLAFKVPPPRVYCRAGHYEKILERANAAGMLTWSPLSSESE